MLPSPTVLCSLQSCNLFCKGSHPDYKVFVANIPNQNDLCCLGAVSHFPQTRREMPAYGTA